MTDADIYITAGELAQVWRCSVYTVRRYCLAGKLRGAFRIGGSWRIPREAMHQGLGVEVREAAAIAKVVQLAR